MDRSDAVPMNEIRGTLILCDQVYRTDQGKWIIAGTYTNWQTSNDELAVPFLQAYVRLQFERPGNYPCRLTLVDRAQAPQARPMIEAKFDVNMADPQVPVFEMGLQLPELRITAPVPYQQRKPGSVIALHTLLWLTVKDTEVASCRLDFLFSGPPLPGQPPRT
jgi:hypothetical protein